MLLLQYLNEKEKYSISFGKVSQNIVQITGNFPVKTSGFTLSREGKTWKGDYSDYTTVYRKVEGGVQFSNDGSVYIPPEPVPEPEPYVPTLEEVQEMKVAEMEAVKQQLIQAGFDVILADGTTTEHFTLTIEEQIELSALQQKVKDGVPQLPWHIEDESEHCKFYANEDMALIVEAAFAHKSWHRTYFQDLRIYIRSLDSKEAVDAVTYGMEIPEDNRSEPLQEMMAALNE